MKKLILLIGIVLTSISSLQATTLNENETTIVSEIYTWNVKTKNGTFSGISTSLSHAKKMVRLTTTGDIVVEQKIVKHYVFKKDQNNRVYFWEVESASSKASGFSSTLNDAKRLIKLVSKGDIITYKIIVNEKK